MLKQTIFFCLMITTAMCDVEIVPLEEKPAEYSSAEGCYLSKTNKLLDYGETLVSADPCQEIYCTQNYTSVTSCPSFPEATSTNPGDTSADYPACCPTPVYST